MHEFGPGWGHSDKTNLRGKRRKPARVECAEPAFKVSEAGVGYLIASAPYMTLFDPSHISSSPHTSLSALFITSFTQIQRDPSIKSIKSSLLCLYMTLFQPSHSNSSQHIPLSALSITSAKIQEICWQITFATLMRPLPYDSRLWAAKANCITQAATAARNLDAAITMRSAATEMQNTLRGTAPETAAPKPDGSRRHSNKKDNFETLFKRNF